MTIESTAEERRRLPADRTAADLEGRPAAAPLGRPGSASGPGSGVLVAVLACLGIFAGYLPITAVQVSLPSIQHGLGTSTSGLQWVSDALILPMAALIFPAGVFALVHGSKKVFLTGLTLVAAGAAVGLAATVVQLLWIGDALLGAGTACLLPSTLALISQAAPDPRRRTQYIAAWAGSLSLAMACGVALAGVIDAHASWRWIYAPLVPIAVTVGVLGAALLAKSPGADRGAQSAGRARFDWPGQALSAIAIVGVVYGVIEGGANGWMSTQAIAGLAAAVVAAAAFVVAERRAAQPMLDLALFTRPAFTAVNLVALLSMFGLNGTVFVLSLFFGDVQHLGPLGIAGRFLVFFLALTVAGPVAGRMAQRFGAALTMLGGLLLSGAALAPMAAAGATWGAGVFSAPLAVFGFGFGLVLGPVTAATVAAVEPGKAGMAAAASSVARMIGGSLGPAVLGAVLTAAAAGGGLVHATRICIIIAVAAMIAGALCATVLIRRDPTRSSR